MPEQFQALIFSELSTNRQPQLLPSDLIRIQRQKKISSFLTLAVVHSMFPSLQLKMGFLKLNRHRVTHILAEKTLIIAWFPSVPLISRRHQALTSQMTLEPLEDSAHSAKKPKGCYLTKIRHRQKSTPLKTEKILLIQ